MALVKMKDLLLRAQKENKGCGAFSVGNMEMVKGAIKAAEELDTPIILQIAEVSRTFTTASDGTYDVRSSKKCKSRCCGTSGSWIKI